MKKLKIWIATARPPTLLLSICGILVGSSLAFHSENFSWIIFVLILITAICLQVLANFSNDYGDFTKGTDNQNRKGPKRALQKGLLSLKEIKVANRILIVLIYLLGCGFLFISFGFQEIIKIIFIVLALSLSVIAAIRYTVGNNAYGYRGYGDLSVFLFFGGFSVLGTQYVLSHELTFLGLLWAIVIGCSCVLVLNINNIRDMDNDRLQNKRTLAVKLGQTGALIYHYGITSIIIVLLVLLELRHHDKTLHGLVFYSIVIMLYLLQSLLLEQANKKHKMNLMLKLLSVLTFLIGLFSFMDTIIRN